MAKENSRETPGLNTIMGLVGDPPMENDLSYDTVRMAEGLKQVWNSRHIAFIPYCMKCKEPLVWVNYHTTLFKCSKCNRIWVKDKEWIKNEKKRKPGKTKKSPGGTENS